MLTSINRGHATTLDPDWQPSWRHAAARSARQQLMYERLAIPLGVALVTTILLFALAAGTLATLAVLADSARVWLP